MPDREFLFLVQQADRLADVQDAGNLVDFTIVHQQFIVVARRQLMLDIVDRH